MMPPVEMTILFLLRDIWLWGTLPDRNAPDGMSNHPSAALGMTKGRAVCFLRC